MTKKVLFVSSGNKKGGISPIVFNQGESIKDLDIEVDYFLIKGKGLKGYLSHYKQLKRKIQTENYMAIHAHYSICGILATLASPGNKRIIVSLMGSFYKTNIKYYLIKLFAFFSWYKVIVKSEKMSNQIKLKNSYVIPNGVRVEKYNNFYKREQIRQELEFDKNKKYVVFVADLSRPEKNFPLCKDTVALLEDESVELVLVYNKTIDEVIKYQIAADVLMLTSLTEGSPNVIKEAMAAACPIVTTDVGDVRLTIGDTEGCFVINSFKKEEAVIYLKKALSFNKRTEGPQRIQFLGLDGDSIAKKIIKLYTI